MSAMLSIREFSSRLKARWSGAPAGDVPVRDWVNVGTGQPTKLAGFDQTLVWVVLALLGLGLLMVYSASIAMPDNPKFSHYLPTHFLLRHVLSILLSLLVALTVMQLPVAYWERAAPWLFVAALVMLVIVLIPFIGKGVNGARRWLPLGVINFQPSELAKLAIAMYAASYMVRKMEARENFIQAVWPMAASLAVVGVLLLA